MQFNTYVSSLQDIEHCAKAENLQEVLLEPALLARQGQLSPAKTQALAQAARQQGLNPVLVWDILMPERVMTQVCEQLQSWDLTTFAAVRVCDVGAGQWLKTAHPTLPLHLIVETGNHNQAALGAWADIFAPTLERLVLSIELPEEKLIEYCHTLPVPSEVLGLGPILLFYSPRSLLAQPLQASSSKAPLYIQATATSARTSLSHFKTKRVFPTLETQHGTLLFLDKDQFILDRFHRLRAAGLHTLGLDLRHLGEAGQRAVGIERICQKIFTDVAGLRKNWPRPTQAPFFKTNNTTAQFSRLKSKLHPYRDGDCLAELVATEKGQFVAFYTLQPFATTGAYRLVLPSAEVLELPKGLLFRTLDDRATDYAEAGQLLVSNWVKKACSGALLCRPKSL